MDWKSFVIIACFAVLVPEVISTAFLEKNGARICTLNKTGEILVENVKHPVYQKVCRAVTPVLGAPIADEENSRRYNSEKNDDEAEKVRQAIMSHEVFKGLNKTRGLFLRYRELQNESTDNPADLDFTTTELRNSLRSIEWDLEDLEDTIAIAEKNPKHKIDLQELNQRRQFINATKNEIKSMKDKISILKNRDKDITAIQPLLEEDPSPRNTAGNGNINSTNISIGNNLMSTMAAARHSGTKYSKLENLHDSPSHHVNFNGDSVFLGETVSIQQRMLQSQDEQLDVLSDSIGTLKTVSRQIGIEVDEQAVMLDDFGNELELTDSKLDATMRKMGKVLHLSNNDQRQWMAILILSVLLLVVIILFIIL